MLRILQTTLGLGRDAKFLADLKAGAISSPSTGRLRSVNLSGFSKYLGNASKVHELPRRGGLAGFQATSYSIGGFISSFGGLALMSVRQS